MYSLMNKISIYSFPEHHYRTFALEQLLFHYIFLSSFFTGCLNIYSVINVADVKELKKMSKQINVSFCAVP